MAKPISLPAKYALPFAKPKGPIVSRTESQVVEAASSARTASQFSPPVWVPAMDQMAVQPSRTDRAKVPEVMSFCLAPPIPVLSARPLSKAVSLGES